MSHPVQEAAPTGVVASFRHAFSSPTRLRTEVLGGLVVALALIPEAIAFSILAGVDPRVGLFASVTMAVTIAFTGGRPAMISAATGAVALVIAPVMRDHGYDYFIATVLFAGVIQIAMAVLGVAKLMRFIPRSVMTGFVNALGILVFMAQLPHLWDVPWLVYPLFILGIGIVLGFPRLTTAVPAPLITIVVLTGIVVLAGWNVPDVADQGELPSSLPELFVPAVPLPGPWELVEVIDGDTLDVAGPDGSVVRVRLIGINAPELGECLYDEAADALRALASGGEIVLVTDLSEADRFGRKLRYVEVEGQDAGAVLIRLGLAVPRAVPPDTLRDFSYRAVQGEAEGFDGSGVAAGVEPGGHGGGESGLAQPGAGGLDGGGEPEPDRDGVGVGAFGLPLSGGGAGVQLDQHRPHGGGDDVPGDLGGCVGGQGVEQEGAGDAGVGGGPPAVPSCGAGAGAGDVLQARAEDEGVDQKWEPVGQDGVVEDVGGGEVEGLVGQGRASGGDHDQDDVGDPTQPASHHLPTRRGRCGRAHARAPQVRPHRRRRRWRRPCRCS